VRWVPVADIVNSYFGLTAFMDLEALAARAAAQPGEDRPLALDTLGRIQAARGRCGEAVATLREALEAGPLLDATRRSLLDGLAQAEACVAR